MSIVFLIIFALVLVAAYKLGLKTEQDNVLGGVCAGIATYTKLPPNLIRVLACVLCVVTGGIVALLYIGLWITLPAREQ